MYFNSNLFRANNYNRQNAVTYAIKYALNPNTGYKFLASHGDGGGDCSNFISQCLHAGGAPMSFDTSRPWWYKSIRNNDTWSVSWTVAHSLYWCLKVRGNNNIIGLKGIEVFDMDTLELGDIIQYENSREIIYHSAIITNFTYEKGLRVPLISQHSFNALNISYVKPAAKRTHFMKIKV
jgi:cell wall-associated NlpC family hydrolase